MTMMRGRLAGTTPANGMENMQPAVVGSDGSVYTLEQANIAGLRNPASINNSYLIARPEANLVIIGTTSAVTIGAGAANDTHLIGIFITAPLTGTCVITGFANQAGTATSITLPAATAAGFRDFFGARNSAGPLTVTCSNAADNNLVSVLWRPI